MIQLASPGYPRYSWPRENCVSSSSQWDCCLLLRLVHRCPSISINFIPLCLCEHRSVAYMTFPLSKVECKCHQHTYSLVLYLFRFLTSCFYIPLFSNIMKSLCPGLCIIHLSIMVIVWQGLSAPSKLMNILMINHLVVIQEPDFPFFLLEDQCPFSYYRHCELGCVYGGPWRFLESLSQINKIEKEK